MASENETVEDIVREMRQVGPYPIYKKPIFTNPKSVSESYLKRFMYGQFVTDYGTVIVENPKVKEVSNYSLADRIESAWRREKAELQLAIDAEKARHTDDYKDEYIRIAKDEIDTLKREIDELRKCLKEVLDAYVCKGGAAFEDGCKGCVDAIGCRLPKWRKAIEGTEGGEK